MGFVRSLARNFRLFRWQLVAGVCTGVAGTLIGPPVRALLGLPD